MTAELDYTQVTELSRRLRFAGSLAGRRVDAWLVKEVGEPLVKEMQRVAPVDTGNLRSNIRMIHSHLKVSVGPIGVGYTVYVVEGTKPHEIKAKNGGVLAFQMGGTMVYAKKVNHPGTKPNTFMDDAAQVVLDKAWPKLSGILLNLEKGSTNG